MLASYCHKHTLAAIAYLYRRRNSAFWWIGFSKASRRPPESTKLRWDDPAQSRAAHDLLRQAQSEERLIGIDRMKFSQWVPKFISERYGNHKANLKSYTNRWRSLFAFLSEKEIAFPNNLTAEHAWNYLFWRTDPKTKRPAGIRTVRKNTALEELKFLRMLMRHAVVIGYAARNSLDGLRMTWEDQKEKPEILEADLPTIWKALRSEPQWMQDAFEIGFYTGCRLSETGIPLHRVDMDGETISLIGKGNRPFVIPLPPQLKPLFVRLKTSKRTKEAAVELPSTASVDFCHFFKTLGMPYSFHSLRVSFITRCVRAGLPENATMMIVNHASVTISRLYQRWRAVDLRKAAASINHPVLGSYESTDADSANVSLEPQSQKPVAEDPSPDK